MTYLLLKLLWRLLFWGIIALGSVFGLILLFNLLMPFITATYLAKKTGFETRVERLSIDPFSQLLQLEKATLHNPIQQFDDTDFLRINQIQIRANPSGLTSKERIEIDEVIVDLEQVAYVKNQKEQTNVASFIASFQSRQEPTNDQPERKKRPFLIHHFTFRLHTLKIADYTYSKPNLLHFDVAIERQFKNVTAVDQIMKPLEKDLLPYGLATVVKDLFHTLSDPATYKEALINTPKSILEKTGETAIERLQAVGSGVKTTLDFFQKE